MKLIIVESKAKQNNFLAILHKIAPQEEWRVEIANPLLFQLANGGEDNTGVIVREHGVYVQHVPRGAKGVEIVQSLWCLAQQAEEVIFATDQDQIGEYLAWHLLRDVSADRCYWRIVCSELTEKGIQNAMKTKRRINLDVVEAQQAREVLDRLIGYKLSTLLQRVNHKIIPNDYNQSAALRLLVNQEKQVLIPFAPYCTLSSIYREGFEAVYIGLVNNQTAIDVAIDQAKTVGMLAEDRRVTIDDAVDPHTPEENSGRHLTQEEARKLLRVARQNAHTIMRVDTREVRLPPPPPLKTSTLQQVAGIKLGFSCGKTMHLARNLFEGIRFPSSIHGVITYYVTDSVSLSQGFCESVRHWLIAQNRDCLLPAHSFWSEDRRNLDEAIRPIDVRLTPALLKEYVSEEELQLYDLIWSRAVASQCKSATLLKSQVVIQAGQTLWGSQGSTLQSAGYTYYWQNVREDVELPVLTIGQQLEVGSIYPCHLAAVPPQRFTESKFIQLLEQLHICNSKYTATLLEKLKQRGYVEIRNEKLMPTAAGIEADTIMLDYFPELTQSEFVSHVEKSLEKIAGGDLPWERFLTHFYSTYLSPALERAKQTILTRYEQSEMKCPKCNHPLIKVPTRFSDAPKSYYLRCQQDGCDSILVWNSAIDNWVLWHKAAEKAVEKTSGQLTNFCCQICGAQLEEYEFSLEDKTKKLLRCSMHHDQADHSQEMYFQSRGGYWNPSTRQEPTTEAPFQQA